MSLPLKYLLSFPIKVFGIKPPKFKNFSIDNNYCYQVKCNPLNFINILIKMSLEIEKKQEKNIASIVRNILLIQ